MSESFFDITLHYLAPVGAVILLGLLGGKIARKFRLPKVTGYIVMGLLIGPSVTGLISESVISNLTIVNDIALGLILFAIGEVFEIHHIRSIGNRVFWITVGQTVGVLVLVTSTLYLVGIEFLPALLMGIIAIETAPAATMLVLREFHAKGEFTDTLTTVVGTTVIICILAFELVFSVVKLPADSSLLVAFLYPLYEIGGSLIVGAVFGYIIAKLEHHVDDQAEMLLIIIAGVLLVTGVSKTLGLQPLLAALIMGAVTTNLSLMHRLVYAELRGIEQPIYIAFFVLAGASLHIDLLPALGLAGIGYLVTRTLGKVIGTYLVVKWKKYPVEFGKFMGIGMVVHAGAAIGLVQIVTENDALLAATIAPLVLASVLIYETFGPPLIRYVLLKVGDAQLPEQ